MIVSAHVVHHAGSMTCFPVSHHAVGRIEARLVVVITMERVGSHGKRRVVIDRCRRTTYCVTRSRVLWVLLLGDILFEAARKRIICCTSSAPGEGARRTKRIILLVGVTLAIHGGVVDTTLWVPWRHIVVVMDSVTTERAVILTVNRLTSSDRLVRAPVWLALIVLLDMLATIEAIMAVTVAIIATILRSIEALLEVVIDHL